MGKRKFEAEQMRKWCNLPNDILTRIHSHLFGKDYARFVSVCRSWRSAPPPLRSSPNPLSTTSQYPSLFLFSGNSSNCNFYDPFYNGPFAAQIPDELIDARIFFSNHGWFLMSLGTQLFFFHPFSKQRIDLPVPTYLGIYDCGRMCFSSPPTSSDCMVFGIDGDSRRGCYIGIIHRGDASWTNFDYGTTKVNFYSSHSNPVCYKGAFYSLTIDGKLGVFDTEKMRQGLDCWNVFYDLKYPCESIQENFLVESNGELISICIGLIGTYVRVFRLKYDNEIRWEEVLSLGDQMIFASRTGCISMQTHTLGNTIYFPSFNKEGNGLFYSLASQEFHSLGLGLARKDLNNTRQMLHYAWITPTALDTCTKDELIWFQNHKEFIPSSERLKVMEAPSARPSFILTNQADSKKQLFFNMFDSCHNAEVLPEVRQMRTATCAYGWLFQYDQDSSDCLLLNPQTMEKIHLPQLHEDFNICAISSSPNDPNCIVLLIYCEGYKRINFIYCRPGESEWTMVKVFKNMWKITIESNSTNAEEEAGLNDLISHSVTNIIGYKGKIFGLVWPGEWAEIEFHPTFKVTLRSDVDLPRACRFGEMDRKNYMVDSCGELFVVQINIRDDDGASEVGINPSKILEVEVFKLDFTRKKWEKVGSLGENIAFFCYGQNCCISSSSMEAGKGNTIYFIGCFSYDETIYAFHFEDGSVSISSPFPELDVNDFEWTALTLS